MLSFRTRFRLPRSARLTTLRATLRLLYRCHPRAFLTSSIASLFEPLFYPALLLLLHQLLQEVILFSGAMYELQEHNAPNQLRMEALTNMQVDASWQRDVRVYQSDIIAREHAWLAETYLTDLKRLTARFAGLRTLAALVQGLGIALALTALFAIISRGQISLPSLAIILPGLALLSGMIQSLIYSMRSLIESLNYAATLFDFLAQPFEQEHAISLSSGTQVTFGQRLSAISLRRVSYTYPENQKKALVDISCDLMPGLTAIVGTNGAGKSTLVKLLTGLVPPTMGSLHATLATGEEVPLSTCAKAVLFQDPSHFHFSIRQNVTMQSERTPGEEQRITEALRLAGLWEVVEAMPEGIDTVVGAGFGGVSDLSGGTMAATGAGPAALPRRAAHHSG
jgi:ATP-binding cassette subfamily B protein